MEPKVESTLADVLACGKFSQNSSFSFLLRTAGIQILATRSSGMYTYHLFFPEGTALKYGQDHE
jgi:hypothetical protein